MISYSADRLLLLSLAAGAGHVQAAEAIAAEVRQNHPKLKVKHIEISSCLDLGLRPGLTTTFHFLARYLPSAWGLFYRLTDSRLSSIVIDTVSHPLKRLGARRLYRAIASFAPDHIICTNGVAALAIADPPLDLMAKTPFSIVMTDYAPHQYWAAPSAAHYFVPTETVRVEMIKNYGLPEEKTLVSGVPIHPKFYTHKNLKKPEPRQKSEGRPDLIWIKKNLGLPKDQPVILVLAGGEGLMPTADAVAELLARLPKPAQIVAVAGHSRVLYRRLRRLTAPPGMKLTALGWTNRLDEYMRAANVVVSKPGGLTTAECIALRRPLIALSPIPKLEEKNAEYISSLGLGVRVDRLEELVPTVIKYLAKTNPSIDPGKQSAPAARLILKTILTG